MGGGNRGWKWGVKIGVGVIYTMADLSPQQHDMNTPFSFALKLDMSAYKHHC